ncbi:hypothetical protein FJTKL_12205 [Diaporthe vaccinii]|uniref:Folylpolyglutamate synthase n=1 Tax=Diaporthe vaccinii TaxID=105482 RepID=A0ABR4EEQ5_9PEZI
MMNGCAHPRPLDSEYMVALNVLHNRRRPQRPTEPANDESNPSGNGNPFVTPGLRGTPGIHGMTKWIQQLGYSVSKQLSHHHNILAKHRTLLLTRLQFADINKLNIIHVAGTKGKGSTCAWAESFLRAHGKRTGFPEKTGLYTSPHLICPEERIRINSEPLCKEKFARYVFEVWDHLLEQNDGDTSAPPRYLQLLLLVAFHAFISEGVQAAIIETHHGGEYDSTNVVDRPVATVVTSLGMDHIEQLGPTIGNIAWHKAGIFKHGAHAFSAPQDSATAVEVLRRRASEKGVPLQLVSVDESLLPAGSTRLKPAVQMLNWSVGLAVAHHFLSRTTSEDSYEEGGVLDEDDIRRAVEAFSWPGRFQLVFEGHHEWYLDSAHNEMSVSRRPSGSLGVSVLSLAQAQKRDPSEP